MSCKIIMVLYIVIAHSDDDNIVAHGNILQEKIKIDQPIYLFSFKLDNYLIWKINIMKIVQSVDAYFLAKNISLPFHISKSQNRH